MEDISDNEGYPTEWFIELLGKVPENFERDILPLIESYFIGYGLSKRYSEDG